MNEIKMRRSRVLHKLRAGEVVNCYRLNLDSARVIDLAAMHGFDCLWVDLEHTGTDWSLIEKQIYAAKARDVDLLVRVPRGAYSDYIRPLELDATGIMVPHLMSASDAQNVARMTRFQPIGLRAVDSGNADGAFCNIPLQKYLQQANEQRFVIVQIEDPEPLEELEAIAAVEGIDMLFFGPADFSHAIGAPGQTEHPRVVSACRRVAEVCAAHGKIAGTVSPPYDVAQLVEWGYRFLNIGADVIALSRHFKELLGQWELLTASGGRR